MSSVEKCWSCEQPLVDLRHVERRKSKIRFCSYLCHELFFIQMEKLRVEEKEKPKCCRNLYETDFKYIKLDKIKEEEEEK